MGNDIPDQGDFPQVPKVLGADVELGNFVEGASVPVDTGSVASRILLSEIAGTPGNGVEPVSTWMSASSVVNIQDWGRKFLPGNGGCAYIDLDHLELALPETRSAFDQVAQWRAMLGIARDAMTRVNAKASAGRRVQVLANCSDGLGHSYGSHVSVLVTRQAWDNIITRRPHYLACLTAFQASSIVFTGQGKVGSENGRTPVPFQLSQRADFIETLLSHETTIHRPIINSRDEPLCGSRYALSASDAGAPELARLHVIFFDSTLCQVASLLRAGVLQIVVAMIEAGRVNVALALDDPLEALDRWSHDPSLRARARTTTGADLTAVEMQRHFLDEAMAFADEGGLDGIVPRADEILALWGDTLDKLEARNFPALARRLDWVLKQQILERVMAKRPALTWASPEIKHLDQLFASLDEQDGLFWAHEHAGLVDRVVSDEDIEHARHNPPEDTRAWTRAHLLRLAGSDASEIDQVDWDLVRVKICDRSGDWPRVDRRAIRLVSPYGATRALNEQHFGPHRTLKDVVERLDAEPAAAIAAPSPAVSYWDYPPYKRSDQ